MTDTLAAPDQVKIRELIGWPLDSYPYRDRAVSSNQLTAAQSRAAASLLPIHEPAAALHLERTEKLRPLLSAHLLRRDLHHEYAGLDWTLGVVDLHHLLAFQRRLVLDQAVTPAPLPHPDDWPALLDLALNASRDVACTHQLEQRTDGMMLTVHSPNPDLHLLPGAGPGVPFSLTAHGGTPFFEVASFGNRWFLRDGYHRAYRLLQAGVRFTIAVVLHVRSLAELGAVHPWFFRESDLRSERPPRLLDFLDDRLTLTYTRPRLQKVIRIRVQESLESIPTGDPS